MRHPHAGLIAAQVYAAKRLKDEGLTDIGLLYVVGEEDGSDGAKAANAIANRNKFLINGEPTESQQAIATKGALRVVIEAKGRAAHSAYPELGESAIEKLLDALERLRRVEWPVHPVLGPSTLNIGTISGGRAPNVIPDIAKAELLIRLVDDPEPVRRAVEAACAGLVEAREQLCIPAILMEARDGFETAVMKYTTDIPAFGGAWGKPLLLGPGTIHVAHTSQERVPKSELLKAAALYAQLVRQLLEEGKSEA